MEQVIMYFKVFGVIAAVLLGIALILYIVEKCVSISKLKDEKLAFEMIQQEEDLAIKIKKEQLNNLKKVSGNLGTNRTGIRK